MGNSWETQESEPSSYGEMAATAAALAKASSKDFMVDLREWVAVRIQTIFLSFLVKIHRLLLQSRYRTRKKEEADLFFVPTYVKCVRMMGGLSDKEINQTYVKVLGQMPYFRLSGGRNHIFVFPRPTFKTIDDKTIDEDSVIKLASKSVPLDCIASHTPEITLGKIDISLRW